MATNMAQPTVSYRDFGPVEVLAIEGSLSRIRTDNDNAFWVPSAKLKRAATKPAADLPIDPPELVPDNDENVAAFIAHVNATGFILRVDCREDGLATAEAEYVEWCGEELPAAAVRHYENRPIAREWRLTFDIKGLGACPFPVAIMGTNSRQSSKTVRVLMHSTGRAYCYYAAIIERLVRAGLRVTA